MQRWFELGASHDGSGVKVKGQGRIQGQGQRSRSVAPTAGQNRQENRNFNGFRAETSILMQRWFELGNSLGGSGVKVKGQGRIQG